MVVGQPPFCDEDPMGIYQRILAGKIFFTKNFDKNCRMLVKKILVADLSKRYGNLKAGADDIVQHKWFQGVNWEQQLQYKVNAPYIWGRGEWVDKNLLCFSQEVRLLKFFNLGRWGWALRSENGKVRTTARSTPRRTSFCTARCCTRQPPYRRVEGVD